MIYTAPNDIVVGKNGKVVVMFNQPMVSLENLDNQNADNIRIQIEPETKGAIKWIDTSSFQFVPDEHLQFASSYNVTILSDTTAVNGGTLEEEYSFSFETIHPKIVSFEPHSGYALAGPTTPLKINFNQPIGSGVT